MSIDYVKAKEIAEELAECTSSSRMEPLRGFYEGWDVGLLAKEFLARDEQYEECVHKHLTMAVKYNEFADMYVRLSKEKSELEAAVREAKEILKDYQSQKVGEWPAGGDIIQGDDRVDGWLSKYSKATSEGDK
jgi:hypothetical protein